MLRLVILGILLPLLLSTAFGQSLLNAPGLIPLEKDSHFVAADLSYKGTLLGMNEAVELKARGLDLSTFNPISSDIWNNELDNSSSLTLKVPRSIEYESSVLSRTGNFRFLGKNGQEEKSLMYVLGKRAHDILLFKALLQKLGYKIPAVTYVPKISIRFANSMEKEAFVIELKTQTLASPDRWITQEDDQSVVLQDLLAMESDITSYNLAMGFIPKGIINSRRSLNSLLVAYSFLETNESINQMSWSAGRILNEKIMLPYSGAGEFYPSWEDAKWMARKITSLSLSQLNDVVLQGQFPKAVGLLLLEKLKNKRNHLLHLFGIQGRDFDVNFNITTEPELVKGKLLKGQYPGHASIYAYPDPLSPFNLEEIVAYFEHLGIGNALEGLVELFNSKVLPKIDTQELIKERGQELIENSFKNSVAGNAPKTIPLGVYPIPMLRGSLIAARDVVMGTYMGTDNMISLADTIGLSIEAGVFLLGEGLPTDLPMSGEIKGHYNKTYSHIRPVTSLKTALKVPFKNILVPLTLKKISHFFDGLDLSQGHDHTMGELLKPLEVLKEELPVGHSLIITDSLGAGLKASGSFRLNYFIEHYVSWKGSQALLKRIHIHRSSEDQLQIYISKANVKEMTLTYQFKTFVPLVTYEFGQDKIVDKTLFYQLNLSERSREEGELTDTLLAMMEIFSPVKIRTEILDQKFTPFTVEHVAREKENSLNVLFLNTKSINVKGSIDVTYPEGQMQKHLFRQIISQSKGISFSNVATDSANYFLDDNSIDVNVSIHETEDPADSLFGHSFAKTTYYEALRDEKTGEITHPYLGLSHTWRGMYMSRNKIQKIINEINHTWGQIFEENVLGPTSDIQLYQIKVRMNVYQKGIDHLKNLTKNQIRDTLKKYADLVHHPWFKGEEEYGHIFGDPNDRVAKKIYKYFQLAQKFSDNEEKRSQYMAKGFSGLEMFLPPTALGALLGGQENYFVVGTIDGLKSNNENGDLTVISNTIGKIGSYFFNGPSDFLREKIGMTSSEFNLLWLLRGI